MNKEEAEIKARLLYLAETRREAKRKRNLAMQEMYKSGMTLDECGQSYGITRERVRQILEKAGVERRDQNDSVYYKNLPTWEYPCESPSCGKTVTYRGARYKGIHHFCGKKCQSEWWDKFSVKRNQTHEDRKKAMRDRARQSYATPEGKKARLESKRKFEASPAYLEWYKRYWGHEKRTRAPRNTEGTCVIEGCTLKKSLYKINVRGKSYRGYKSTCYKHNMDGSLKKLSYKQ